MSVLVTSYVWHQSPVAHRGDLLVLLVLADHAHDDGAGAYPSVETIAAKARLTRRGTQIALRRLEEHGAILPTGAIGPHGTVEYRVLMPDPGEVTSQRSHFAGEDSDAEGRTETHEGAKGSSPEPSVTVKEPSPSSSAVADDQESPDDAVRLCRLLADLIRANDHAATPNPESKSWRTAARLLLDKDGRTFEEIEHVMRWALNDSFWRSNVLSMPKLREKFGQLVLRAGSRRPQSMTPPPAEFSKYDTAGRRPLEVLA